MEGGGELRCLSRLFSGVTSFFGHGFLTMVAFTGRDSRPFFLVLRESRSLFWKMFIVMGVRYIQSYIKTETLGLSLGTCLYISILSMIVTRICYCGKKESKDFQCWAAKIFQLHSWRKTKRTIPWLGRLTRLRRMQISTLYTSTLLSFRV